MGTWNPIKNMLDAVTKSVVHAATAPFWAAPYLAKEVVEEFSKPGTLTGSPPAPKGLTKTGTSLSDDLRGSGGDDTLRGESGDDVLRGLDGDDRLYGGNDDDVLIGGAGGDRLGGGAGEDWASYAGAGSDVVADLISPSNNKGDAKGDTYLFIENLRGSDHDDTLSGNDAANVIDGGAGWDNLHGRGGDDTFIGGLGNDWHYGGAGYDTMDYSGSSDGVTINWRGGVSGYDAAGDKYSSIEKFVLTDHADDYTGRGDIFMGDGDDRGDLTGSGKLFGEGGDDLLLNNGNRDGALLDGGRGHDFLVGSNGTPSTPSGPLGTFGADTLIGGNGNDLLHGGDGGDTLVGGTGGFDVATYDWAVDKVVVDASAMANSRGDAAGDFYSDIEAIHGSDYGDVLTAGNGVNVIFGGAGEDTIEDSAGRDFLFGGTPFGDSRELHDFLKGLDEAGGFEEAIATFDTDAMRDGEMDVFTMVNGGAQYRSEDHEDFIFGFETGLDRIELSYENLLDEWEYVDGGTKLTLEDGDVIYVDAEIEINTFAFEHSDVVYV